MPKACNRIAILADAHVPYHSVDAITCALEWCKDHDINTYLLSEWLDCHHLSEFVKDPRKRHFKGDESCHHGEQKRNQGAPDWNRKLDNAERRP